MNFFSIARIDVLGNGEGEGWKRDKAQSCHWSGAAKGLPVEWVSCKVFFPGEPFPLGCLSVSLSKAQMRLKSRARVRVRVRV